jgi:hypothetical protein
MAPDFESYGWYFLMNQLLKLSPQSSNTAVVNVKTRGYPFLKKLMFWKSVWIIIKLRNCFSNIKLFPGGNLLQSDDSVKTEITEHLRGWKEFREYFPAILNGRYCCFLITHTLSTKGNQQLTEQWLRNNFKSLPVVAGKAVLVLKHLFFRESAFFLCLWENQRWIETVPIKTCTSTTQNFCCVHYIAVSAQPSSPLTGVDLVPSALPVRKLCAIAAFLLL